MAASSAFLQPQLFPFVILLLCCLAILGIIFFAFTTFLPSAGESFPQLHYRERDANNHNQ